MLDSLTGGQFAALLAVAQHLLACLAFVDETGSADSASASTLPELISAARECALVASIELARQQAKDTPVRQQVLAALMTHCKLSLPHKRLTLRQAMNTFFKQQMYPQAIVFAERLRSADPEENDRKRAEKVIAFCRQKQSGEAPASSPDVVCRERDLACICSVDLRPLTTERDVAECSWCHARAASPHRNKPCVVCLIGQYERF
jgi:hypothetical protein